ncbi:hypothetical protein NP511_17780 [Natrinema thermotolerans]|uniref:Uncharacterized protein n=2 Tax=Natrinema thermotolerans TaxID=121872 RepID=A0AAF0P9Z7_9EURY|nr:hypothetical protein [Natrinema thermotolerans]WMT07225.1 hypothetical protein NP511_17780 [Natrinema thermotolerans]
MSAWHYTKLLAQLIAVARREELTNVYKVYAFADHETVPVMPIGHPDSTVEGSILGLARTHESTGYVFFSLRLGEDPTVQNIEVTEMGSLFEPERVALLHDDVESTESVHPGSTVWRVHDDYIAELPDEEVPNGSDTEPETTEEGLGELFG